MNKKVLGIIIGVIAVIALVFFFMSGDKGADNGTSTTDDNASAQQSLSELLASGRSQTCTFSDATDSGSYTGTVYVGAGKMRSDFDTTANGQTTKAHMIVDGQTSYTWMDGMMQGYKMAFDAQAQVDTSSQQAALDPEKKVDYRCDSGSVNSAMFDLPSGVTFSDFSSMMPQVPAGGTGTEASGSTSGSADLKAMQCAACDSLTGDEQTQCKAALSCN